MDKAKLKPADVTALCSAGAAAWETLPASGRVAVFMWRGKRYKAKRTIFRLMIDTLDGKPVACRWD